MFMTRKQSFFFIKTFPDNLAFVPHFFILMVIFSLSACSIEDDFGRSYTPHLQENIGDVVGSIQENTGLLSRNAAYHIPLTDHEHTLRQTLVHFQKPFLSQRTLREPLKRQTIAKHRSHEGFRSDFLHDIESDQLWIGRFDRAVEAVIEHDLQRYEVLSSSYEVSDNDERYIKVRIRENRGVAMRVLQLLDRRVSDYDQGIDYGRLQYRERDLLPLVPAMDGMRSQIGVLKSKYETYVYQGGPSNEYSNYK